MDCKRKVSEIITLYELEPTLRDVYVEGVTDSLVLERFFEKYGMCDLKITIADDVDFSELYENIPEIKRNNKKKLVAFSKLMQEEIAEELEGVSVIVDRDYDEVKNALENNFYLRYTDYHSLELYLFNESVINIFYKSVLHGFPFDGKKTLESIAPALVEKFLIRLVLDEKGDFPKEKITGLRKSVEIDKGTGSVNFDAKKHLFKIMNNLQKTGEKSCWLNLIDKYREELPLEIRKSIRGHDFINLFFIFINKIKNTIRMNEETLERSLFQCIDYSFLRKEPLFNELEKKYNVLPNG